MEDCVKLQCSQRRIATCRKDMSADGSSEQWSSVGSGACLLWNLELRDCWVGIWWRLRVLEVRGSLYVHDILRSSSRSSSRSTSVQSQSPSQSQPRTQTQSQPKHQTQSPSRPHERRSRIRLAEVKAIIVLWQLEEGWMCQWRNYIKKRCPGVQVGRVLVEAQVTDVDHVSERTRTNRDLYWRFVFLLSQQGCCRQAVLLGEVICKSQVYSACHDDIASTTSAIVSVVSVTLRIWGLTSWNDFYDVFTSWSSAGRGTSRCPMNKYCCSRGRLRWHLCSSLFRNYQVLSVVSSFSS